MTVRRWAGSGRLKARKLGKRWLIEASSVDSSAVPPTKSKRPLDFGTAISHVLRRRRRQDWLPDALDYDDISNSRDGLLRIVERRWQDGDFEGRTVDHIPVPKDFLSFRPGAFLRLEDEVLLTGLVLNMASQIEGALGPEVHSYRLARPGGRDMLVHQGLAWGRFQEAQRDAPTAGWSHVLVTDVAGFYEYVDPDVLADTLTDLGVGPDEAGAAKGLMKGWHKKSGLRGLPQGPDASAVLSNAYFVPIDEEMNSLARTRGWSYLRWSDDIRVFTKSESEAEVAAYRLSLAARRQGLYLQGSKTRVRMASELSAEATAAELGEAGYLFSIKAMREAKAAIVPIYRRATHGGKKILPQDLTELRFSLYRLGALGDDRGLQLVLRELPRIGFLGDFIYLYLRAFVTRSSVIERATDVLKALEPDRDAYLAGQLLRVLEHAPLLPPDTLDTVRLVASPSQPVAAVRAVAVTVLAHHGTTIDETQIRTALWRESDPRVIRAQLAALARLAPKRSRATLGDYKRANPAYAATVDYLLKK